MLQSYRLFNLLFQVIILLWTVMMIGVLFIAIPMKFFAVQVSLPAVIHTDSIIFYLFNRIEWGVWIAATIVASCASLNNNKWYAIILLLVCILLQTLWLNPIPYQRMILLFLGYIPDKTVHHLAYMSVEFIKLVTLIVTTIQLNNTKSDHLKI